MVEVITHLLREVAVLIPVAFVCMLLSGTLLWWLRRQGYWSLLAAFALEVVLLAGLRFVAPHAVSAPKGEASPVELGVVVGCSLPMLAMLQRHLEAEKGALPDTPRRSTEKDCHRQ